MSPSELTNTIEQFIVYIHRNEAHFNYIYVYHTNVSEADNIYKTLPQMSFHVYEIHKLSRFDLGHYANMCSVMHGTAVLCI